MKPTNETKMKIDAGLIQDLFHYSLAIQGNGASAFPCDTLKHRLQASHAAYMALVGIDPDAPNVSDWESFIPTEWKSEGDLLAYGQRLQAKVCEFAAFHGIDPRTGETLPPDTH